MEQKPEEYFSWGGGDAYEDYARAMIEYAREARPTCDGCRVLSYTQATGAAAFIAQMDDNPECRNPTPRAIDLRMSDHGYECMRSASGYVRRCSVCADARTYPWADRLAVASVGEYIRIQAGYGRTTIAFSELESALPPVDRSYDFPVSTGIEHGQTTRDIALVLKPEELSDAASLVKQMTAEAPPITHPLKPKRGNVGPNVREFF